MIEKVSKKCLCSLHYERSTPVIAEPFTALNHLKARNKGDAQLVVNHKGQHTHLGSTALVELDGTLLQLGRLIERVPSEVNGSVSEVTGVLVSGSFDVPHDSKLKEANEGKNLACAGKGNGEGGIPSVSKIRELGSGVVNVSWKVDSGGVDQVSDNTKHTDTSVLDLDVSKTVELLLVAIGNNSKRIEESKRRLGTKGLLEGVQGGGGGGLLGGGESRGGGDKGGKDGSLHLVISSLTKNCGTLDGRHLPMRILRICEPQVNLRVYEYRRVVCI